MMYLKLNENSMWSKFDDCSLNQKNILDLFENKIPYIRINNFASAVECESLVKESKKIGFDFYENVYPPIGRIGVTQFEHKKDKHSYFEKAKKYNSNLKSIFGKSFDPIKRLESFFLEKALININKATEVDELYFAGLIRHINKALLHMDFAPFDAPSWSIGEIEAQIAWNLYLTPVKSGGECIVYNKPWNPNDEIFKIEKSYGYDEKIVTFVEKEYLTPIVGDIVLHNTRNFHEVCMGDGERITMSSFIGKQGNNFIYWS